MSETSTAPTARVPSGGWRWLLIASVALNLLFIGGVGALWFKGPLGQGYRGSSQSAFGIMMFSRELPPERRNAVRQHLKEARKGLKDLKADLRLARQKAAELLASTSYTPEEMKTAFEAIASAENRMRETGTAALLKSIGELTPDERQKLAAAWTFRLQKEQRRRGKPDRDELQDTLEKQPEAP